MISQQTLTGASFQFVIMKPLKSKSLGFNLLFPKRSSKRIKIVSPSQQDRLHHEEHNTTSVPQSQPHRPYQRKRTVKKILHLRANSTGSTEKRSPKKGSKSCLRVSKTDSIEEAHNKNRISTSRSTTPTSPKKRTAHSNRNKPRSHHQRPHK